jgi:hypothetical protein
MRPLTTFTASFLVAVHYYSAIDKPLALRFIEAVDKARDEIMRFPSIGRVSGKYRVLPVKGFPYNFCYSDDLDGELVAITLFHHKQSDPEKGQS